MMTEETAGSMAPDAVAIDEGLVWCDGSDSPTGRRVLDIRSARAKVVSTSSNPEEAFCSVNAPDNVSELIARSPADAVDSTIDWTFDAADVLRIRAGFEPSAMEDKWRIVTRDEGAGMRVYFLRSWTNQLIFVVKLENGHARLLTYRKDDFAPTLTARAILDSYLLERVCVLLAPHALGTDKRGLMSYGWSIAGRRCDFVEPAAEMIASEETTRGVATDVPRPYARTMALPHGSSAQDRAALLQVIVEGLLEIRAWPSPGEIGDSNFLILDTRVGKQTFFAQFLSEPGEKGLLSEVASGFYGNTDAYHSTPEQVRAMVSRGFSDGRAGNFSKDLVFDAPDAATTIAEQTLTLLGSVFGWSPESPITAKLHHARRADTAPVSNGLSPNDMIELLTRHGLEGRLTPAGDSAPDDATVEAASRGHRFTVHFADPVEKTSRFCVIAARARVGQGIDDPATNPFNGLTRLGRSWVQDGDAYVEASLRVVGVTEEALHHWLEHWAVVVATARYWYRRVELGGGEALALQPVHFQVGFHNVHRMARCHVNQAAEEAAIGAFAEESRSPKHASVDGIDAWAFFEGYAAAHPEVAMPIEAKFVSSASASDLVPWLERIDGIQATVTTSGELVIGQAVPGGTLLLSPSAVRRVALSPERFALSATMDGASGALDILIGTDDFYFAPAADRIELEGSTFIVDGMAATISWFETKQRLRTLEREIATAGPLICGGTIAWMHGALAGAERVGLVCGAERARFDGVLAAARRALTATRAGNRQ